MDYNEDDVLTEYIWDHYYPIMTDFEQEVGKAIIGRAKAEHSPDPRHATILRQRFGRIGDAAINAALQDGADAFRRQVRDRLLNTHTGQIFINRCPVCQRVVRTPRARQCFWCGHAWHEQSTP